MAGLFVCRTGLLSDVELGQVGADGVERGDDLVRRGQQEEVVGVTGAILQQRRSRVAAGIDLNGVDGDPGSLDVGACAVAGRIRHPAVDQRVGARAVAVPAVERIQAVAEQDDDLIIGIIGISGRRRKRSAADERLPTPDQPNRLIGGAERIQIVDLGLHRRPIIIEARDDGRAVGILLGGKQRGSNACGRRRYQPVIVPARAGGIAAVGDAAVPGAMRRRCGCAGWPPMCV